MAKLKNTIICGDAGIVLPRLSDDYIDLTVTSPPYDDLRMYSGFSFDFEQIAQELKRVTKQGGVVVWVVGDATIKGSETGTSFRQALYFMECGFNLHDTMIYQKSHFANPSKGRYHQIFEYMFVFSKGKPKTFNPILDKPVKYGKPWGKASARNADGTLSTRIGNSGDRKLGMRTNIFKYSTGFGFNTKDKQAHKHPAIFPEQLVADHIKSWSNEGDTILDPFNGSGTTTKMARLLNRSYIGIDVSREYCDIAEQRLSQQVLL